MPPNRKGRKNKGGQNRVDKAIAINHRATGSAERVAVANDTTRQNMSWILTQKPPLNYQSKITWVEETFDQNLSVTLGGGFFELAFGFFLNQLPGVSKLGGLFDQYCIYSVCQRCVMENLGTGTGITTATYGTIISALDYDSNNNVGSYTALQQYGTASESELRPGMSYERYVKPTVSSVTGSGNSTTATGLSIGRAWLNSAFSTNPHFGIRWGTQGNLTGNNLQLKFMTTMVIGLRNNF